MSKFLITVWSFPAHINLVMAVAQALRMRGHQVAFYSGNRARAIVEGEGFTFFPFENVDEAHVYELLRTSYTYCSSLWEALRRARELRLLMFELYVETVPGQIEDLEGVLAEWRPDVFLCDITLLSPILVFSQTRDIPVCVFSMTALCWLPGPEVPAFGRGLPLPRTRLGRLRSTVARKIRSWLGRDCSAGLNALCRRYGLQALPMGLAEWTAKMPLFLIPTVPEFDYERTDLPPSVHYVGACIWDKRKSEAAPAWLNELTGDQPVIHVTEGTLHEHDPFLLRTAARALGGMPVQVVLTTGPHRDPASLDLGAVASNIRVEQYVPHSQLLPKTAVVVCLGGAATVTACLKAAVPLVIVPTEWDKPEIAQRVVEAGAGIRIAPVRCTPEVLRAAVNRLINEPSFRLNAERLAQVFAGYDGPRRAAELLEGLALSRQRFVA